MEEKHNKKIKVDYVRLMMTVLVLGIIVFIITFIVLFALLSNKSGSYKDKEKTDVSKEVDLKNNLKPSRTGSISKIDENKKEITITDLKDGKKFIVSIDNATEYIDETGNSITLSNLKLGQAVTIKYDSETLLASKVKIYSELLELENQKIDEIDFENKKIIIGTSIYNYDDTTVFSYNNKEIDPNSIKSIDVINIKAKEKKLVSVIVSRSHGYINIANKNGFDEAEIELIEQKDGKRNNIFLTVGEVNNKAVTEGTYKLTVDKDGAEIYSMEQLVIKAGEVVEIDLKNSKPVTGEIVLDLNIDKAAIAVFSDETKKTVYTATADARVKLPYGDYKIKASKPGYVNWSQSIKLENERKIVKIELKKEISLSEVKISTDPEFAEVYIDGEYVGTSPIIENVSYGKHDVKVKKSGYMTTTYKIDVNDKTKSYKYTLHKGTGEVSEDDLLKSGIYLNE